MTVLPPVFSRISASCSCSLKSHGRPLPPPRPPASGIFAPHFCSPSLTLGTGANLIYRHWYSTESGFDFGYVEITTNGWDAYSTLATFGGSAAAWSSQTNDLSAYAGKTVQIRFRFTTDGSSVYEGWYVDDVAVTPVSRGGNSITCAWLTASSVTGTVDFGEATNVSLTFSAVGLTNGTTATGTLVVRSNDALSPVNHVPVSMVVEPPVRIAIPAQATEGMGVLTNAGRVMIAYERVLDLTVGLASSDTAEAQVSASVTIPAGQTNACFNLTIVDDTDLDGSQTVLVSIEGSQGDSATITVDDNETATLSVAVPSQVSEIMGVLPGAGRVTLSAPVGPNVAVTLLSSDTTEIRVPNCVVVPPGQTSAVFDVTVVDDGQHDGTQTAWVTAHVQNWTDGSNAIAVLDNTNQIPAVNTNLFLSFAEMYPCGDVPQTAAMGDLNGDGLTDVIVAANTNLYIYLQNESHTLDSPILIPSLTPQPQTRWVCVGDLNSDGLDDLVVAHFGSDRLTIYYQGSNGLPATPSQMLDIDDPSVSAVEDWDGDGLNDLLVMRGSSRGFVVYHQCPTGGFERIFCSFSSLDPKNDLAVADLDGDGLKDVAVLDQQGFSPDLYVHRRKHNEDLSLAVSGGDFLPPERYTITNGPLRGVAAGDVNGDGLNDLVVTYGGNRDTSTPPRLNVYLQGSNHVFTLKETKDAYDLPEAVQILDLDMDGRQDILIGNRGWGAVTVYLQDTNGVLGNYVRYNMFSYGLFDNVRSMAVGDINNDGLPDVASPLASGTNLFVLLHAPPTLPPDFLLRARPPRVTVLGAEATNEVNLLVVPRNGFGDAIAFSASGLLPGMTTDLPVAAVLAAHTNFQVKLTTDATVLPGRYHIVIEAAGASFATSVTVNVSVPDDRDGDDLLDAWEIRYFGSIARYAASDDPDGDGAPNSAECLGHTDPTNGVSRPVRLTVTGLSGEYGSPQPFPYGTNWIPCFSVVTCMVDAAVSDGPGRRRRCAGWMGEGSVLSSGEGNVTVFSLVEDSRLNWRWTNEVALVETRQVEATAAYASTNVSSPWPGEQFDFGTSISASGRRVLVGEPYAYTGDVPWVGRAYVYARASDGWKLEAALSASDGAADDRFGIATALDGDTAVVLAIKESLIGYVYVRDGTNWTLQARLVPHDSEAERVLVSAYAVSVSGDRVALGGANDVDNGNRTDDAGSVYIFERKDSAWTEKAKLTPSDRDSFRFNPDFDRFGGTVSAFGDRVLVGAWNDDDKGVRSGSAYVFRGTETNWVQEAKLIASDGTSNHLFGCSVALGDSLAVIGASCDRNYDPSSVNNGYGAVYVFRREGTNWIQEAKLIPGHHLYANSRFGSSVSLRGLTMLGGTDERGTVFQFTRTPTGWSNDAWFNSVGSVVTIGDECLAMGWPDNGTGLASLLDRPAPPLIFGSVESWFLPGSRADTGEAQAVEIADTSYRFVEWRVNGGRQPDATAPASNPATNLLLSAPCWAVAAYLSAGLDTDRDALPDWWERFYFGSTAAATNTDSDGDGLSNLNEFLAGTNPRDQRSVLAFQRIETEQEDIRVEWTCGWEKQSVLESTTNLLVSESWRPVWTSAVHSVTAVHVRARAPDSKLFFRIRVP